MTSKKVMLVRADRDFGIIPPPLSLGYLASFLEKDGHDVEVVDCLAWNVSPEGLIEKVSHSKPDIVGFSSMTCSYSIVRKLIGMVKERIPSTDVVLGGPHPTALPEFTLRDTGADYAVIGEGELTFSELASGKPPSKISGLAFKEKKSGKIKINRRRPLIKDLDSLPFPAWHLMPPASYPPAPYGFFVKNMPVAPMMTSRGCPFSCTFCASNSIWGRRLRRRSPENVVDEIELLVSEYGAKEIHFEDDNFTLVREHAVGVCKEIIRRKLEISWTCPNGVRIDTLDSELLGLMKESGCYMLALGIESGSQRILDTARKNLDLKLVPKVIENAKKMGIETWGFFMLGLPGETKETIRETIDYAKKLKLDRAQFMLTTPLPGSELWDKWIEGQKLEEIDWSGLNYFTGSAGLTALSRRELEEAQSMAHREFYFRPAPILNFLRKIKPSQGGVLLKRLFWFKFF